MLERTFSMIKPDATGRQLTGEVMAQIEQNGLTIVAARWLWLTQAQAKAFYAEHEGKPFFDTLVSNMTKGPIMVMVLEGDHAIDAYRQLMGPTDPEQASAGTLRSQYALSMQQNTVHGSDSPESAAREIGFFFSETDIFGAVRER